jgi:hypothetical protein
MAGSRLDRRPGAADHFPGPFLDALADRVRRLTAASGAVLAAVDGWGCGGKTALCEGLLDRLEPAAAYLSTDEFFEGFGRRGPDPVTPHLRFGEFVQALRDLRATGSARVRPFDWAADRIGPAQEVAADIVLVEGLFSLRPEVRDFYGLRIWVEGRLDTRMARVVARDGAHMVPFWENEWLALEAAYMRRERPWAFADLVVAGAELPIGQVGPQLKAHG